MRTRKRNGGANGGTNENSTPRADEPEDESGMYPFYFRMSDKQKMLAEAGDPFLVRSRLVKFNKTQKALEDVDVDTAKLKRTIEDSDYDPKQEEKFFYGIANPRTKKLKNSRNYALTAVNNTRKAAWTASGKVGNAARAAATAAKPSVFAAGLRDRFGRLGRSASPAASPAANAAASTVVVPANNPANNPAAGPTVVPVANPANGSATRLATMP
jgi:hypothetical protein